MTASLFRHECLRVVCTPLVWVVVALLVAAGTWGARGTAALHRRQQADVARMARQEAAWYADIRARAERYAAPSPEPLPYWQDPTDAAGFSRYFLRRFAAKPHLPLSPLAVGQSDLQPFAVPLRLETLFGGDRVYDYAAPRMLATGFFDLGFVLTFVFPMALAAAAASAGALERDQGILALVAAQPVAPSRWWLLRLAALACVFVPAAVGCVAVALVAAGVPVIPAWTETAAALALVAAHVVFWLALTGWFLARGHGTVATVSSVAAVWLVLTVLVPLAGALIARTLLPSPSPIAHVSELRRTVDLVQARADAVVAGRLASRFGAAMPGLTPSSLDYSTRLVLITQEMEERLAHQERDREAQSRARAGLARALSWVSPSLAFHTALGDLAGTGPARHREFLGAVRRFQLELRAFMYPYVLEPVRVPRPRVCDRCPARLTFTDYDAIPRFVMSDAPAASRVASGAATGAWLVALAAALVAAGPGRSRRWAFGS